MTLEQKRSFPDNFLRSRGVSPSKPNTDEFLALCNFFCWYRDDVKHDIKLNSESSADFSGGDQVTRGGGGLEPKVLDDGQQGIIEMVGLIFGCRADEIVDIGQTRIVSAGTGSCASAVDPRVLDSWRW